jgi:hypothetical protein
VLPPDVRPDRPCGVYTRVISASPGVISHVIGPCYISVMYRGLAGQLAQLASKVVDISVWYVTSVLVLTVQFVGSRLFAVTLSVGRLLAGPAFGPVGDLQARAPAIPTCASAGQAFLGPLGVGAQRTQLLLHRDVLPAVVLLGPGLRAGGRLVVAAIK